jgi:uncharacterized protein YuzE
MSPAYKYTYDPEANALYIHVRAAEIASQREYSADIILDLAFDGSLVGIEVLDPNADLQAVVKEFGLDPHLLDTVEGIRKLIPDVHKEFVLA